MIDPDALGRGGIPSASELAFAMKKVHRQPDGRYDEIEVPIPFTDDELMRGMKDQAMVGDRPLNVIRLVKLKATEFGWPDGRTKLYWIYEGRVHA